LSIAQATPRSSTSFSSGLLSLIPPLLPRPEGTRLNNKFADFQVVEFSQEWAAKIAPGKSMKVDMSLFPNTHLACDLSEWGCGDNRPFLEMNEQNWLTSKLVWDALNEGKMPPNVDWYGVALMTCGYSPDS